MKSMSSCNFSSMNCNIESHVLWLRCSCNPQGLPFPPMSPFLHAYHPLNPQSLSYILIIILLSFSISFTWSPSWAFIFKHEFAKDYNKLLQWVCNGLRTAEYVFKKPSGRSSLQICNAIANSSVRSTLQICNAIAQCKFAMQSGRSTLQICNAIANPLEICNARLWVPDLKVQSVSAGQKMVIKRIFFMIRYVNDFIKARASRIRRAEAHCKFAMPLQIHRAWAHCNFAMPLHNANVQSSLAGALCKFAMPLHISYNFAMLVCECQTCHTCTGVSRAENCYQTYSLWYVTLKTLSRRELQEFVGQKFFANLQSDFKLIGQKHIAHLQCHCKSITHLQCKFVMVRCARSALVSAGQKIVIKRMFYDTLR